MSNPSYELTRVMPSTAVISTEIDGVDLTRPLYLEAILTPGQSIAAVDRDLKSALRRAGFDRNVKVEPFVVRHGFEADARQVAPIHQALDRAHQLTLGKPIPMAEPFFSSMWRDHNIFNMNRILAAVMGPGRWEPTPEEFVKCARIYALAALAICGQLESFAP